MPEHRLTGRVRDSAEGKRRMRRFAAIIAMSTVGLAVAAHGQRGISGSIAQDTAHGPQKYGVVIGVNQYEDPGISDLQYAVPDARAVFEMLKTIPDGFEDSRLMLLADDQSPERTPTRGTVLRFLKTYVGLAGPEDTLLVYFAGHGTTVDDHLYLLPSDASLSLVEETGVSFSALESMLKGSPARRAILLLDACHSGTGRATDTLSEDAYEDLEQASEGMVVLASCGPNELSHDMPKEGHGAFTYHLLEGLTGKADASGDGLISASELSTYTWEKTRLWAATQGLTQNPWRIERVSGEIVLARSGGELPTHTAIAAQFEWPDDVSSAQSLQGLARAIEASVAGQTVVGQLPGALPGKVVQALNVRTSRAALVAELLDSGHAYESREGLICIIRSGDYKAGKTRRQRDKDALLVLGENDDRWKIYEGLSESWGLGRKGRNPIAQAFFEARVKTMKDGQKYEGTSKEILVKRAND